MRGMTVFPPRHLDHPDFAASSRFILRVVVLGGGSGGGGGGATEPASSGVWMDELSAQGGLFRCDVKPRRGVGCPTTSSFGRAGAHGRRATSWRRVSGDSPCKCVWPSRSQRERESGADQRFVGCRADSTTARAGRRCAHPSRAAGRERAGLVPSTVHGVCGHASRVYRSTVPISCGQTWSRHFLTFPVPGPRRERNTRIRKPKERWTLCTKEDCKLMRASPGQRLTLHCLRESRSCSRIANARRRASCLGWRRARPLSRPPRLNSDPPGTCAHTRLLYGVEELSPADRVPNTKGRKRAEIRVECDRGKCVLRYKRHMTRRAVRGTREGRVQIIRS